MTQQQSDVFHFMLAAEQETPPRPIIPSIEVRKLRYKLIKEELDELECAMGLCELSPNLVETADAIADLLVVVLGTAVAFGIDIEPCFDEVHRSNMTKFIDGHKRADGKWIKGPSYSPANLELIILAQQNV